MMALNCGSLSVCSSATPLWTLARTLDLKKCRQLWCKTRKSSSKSSAFTSGEDRWGVGRHTRKGHLQVNTTTSTELHHWHSQRRPLSPLRESCEGAETPKECFLHQAPFKHCPPRKYHPPGHTMAVETHPPTNSCNPVF